MSAQGVRSFREKHWPSAGTWAFSLLMSVSVGVAVGAATSTMVGAILVAGIQSLQTWTLSKSAFVIKVTPSEVMVGPATLPRWAIGEVVVLDRGELRATLGVNADPAAWLMVRPWTKAAVKIALNDPHDPHPYWVVGTRRPRELAAQLAR